MSGSPAPVLGGPEQVSYGSGGFESIIAKKRVWSFLEVFEHCSSLLTNLMRKNRL